MMNLEGLVLLGFGAPEGNRGCKALPMPFRSPMQAPVCADLEMNLTTRFTDRASMRRSVWGARNPPSLGSFGSL